MEARRWRIGRTLFQCAKHKTFHVYGYARIVVECWLYDLIFKYKDFLRPMAKNFDHIVMNMDDAPLFITRNSTPMDSGYVSVIIDSCWKEAGVAKDFGTVTNFRKSVVGIVHSEKPDSRGDLASLMSHRLSTAECFYKNTFIPAASAVKMVSLVRNCLNLNSPTSIISTSSNAAMPVSHAETSTIETTPVDNSAIRTVTSPEADEVVSTDASPQVNVDVGIPEKPSDNLKVPTAIISPCEKILPVTVHGADVLIEEEEIAKHPRRSFYRNHVDILLSHPDVMGMVANKTVDSLKLRRILGTDSTLLVLKQNYTVAQIRDRIRCVFKKDKQRRNQEMINTL